MNCLCDSIESSELISGYGAIEIALDMEEEPSFSDDFQTAQPQRTTMRFGIPGFERR